MSALTPTVVDVREIPRPQRHSTILSIFDRLASGEAFDLVNDHDPIGLLYQFTTLMPGAFSWEYIVQGPEEWRVRIGRN